jgi:hypothetical protein
MACMVLRRRVQAVPTASRVSAAAHPGLPIVLIAPVGDAAQPVTETADAIRCTRRSVTSGRAGKTREDPRHPCRIAAGMPAAAAARRQQGTHGFWCRAERACAAARAPSGQRRSQPRVTPPSAQGACSVLRCNGTGGKRLLKSIHAVSLAVAFVNATGSECRASPVCASVRGGS